ncbi:hypothetical protein TNCV_909971 [Trichonephila clavipes]|nr:hypothetical protein TNCV_909971 [Trichonephila clavipes]
MKYLSKKFCSFDLQNISALMVYLHCVTNSRPLLKLYVATQTDRKHCECMSAKPEADGSYLSTRAVGICELHPSATRGLLATDHVILNHGQVTWTTPELAPPSPNYHTTPTGERFSSRQI